MPVGKVERQGHLPGDPNRLVYRQLVLPGEPLAEALALDVGHGEPDVPRSITPRSAGLARVVHRDDVGMLEPGGELDLAEEPVGTQGRRQLWVEHLEGDRPVVAQIVGEVNHGHAAAAELALDAVLVGKGNLEASQHIRQGRSGERKGPNVTLARVAGPERSVCHPEPFATLRVNSAKEPKGRGRRKTWWCRMGFGPLGRCAPSG